MNRIWILVISYLASINHRIIQAYGILGLTLVKYVIFNLSMKVGPTIFCVNRLPLQSINHLIIMNGWLVNIIYLKLISTLISFWGRDRIVKEYLMWDFVIVEQCWTQSYFVHLKLFWYRWDPKRSEPQASLEIWITFFIEASFLTAFYGLYLVSLIVYY